MMETPREEEKRHILHSSVDSIDSSSIRSFASSSATLRNSSPKYQDEDDNFGQRLEANDTAIYSPTIGVQQEKHQQRKSWRKTPCTLVSLTHLALQLLLSLVPPLLPSFFFKPKTRRRLHATSYLDGLRGVAALIVFVDHFVLNWFYTLRNGYLATPEDLYILQLPIIRLVFAGRASVGVFFVISGFVLSYKPLKQIRAGNKSDVFDTLASSVFRRGMRLYLPIVFGTLISAFLTQKGYYTPVPARTEVIPPQLPTMRDQLHHWWHSVQALVLAGLSADPNRPFGPEYNGHLWTIPIEFFGSMVVFLGILATARTGTAARILILSIIATLCLRYGRWDLWLFLAGMVLAELSLISLDTSEASDSLPIHHHNHEVYNLNQITSPLSETSPGACITPTYHCACLRQLLTQTFSSLSAFKKPLTLTILTTSLYLLSYAGESPSPGFYHTLLTPFVPGIYEPIYLGPEHFILSLGSVLLVFTLTLSSSLQKAFLSPFAQYLGDVSYALYIVHGMVLFTLGTGLQEHWTGQVGEERWVDNGLGELVEAIVKLDVDARVYGKAFLLCAVANLVVVFWVADLFWRAVDGRVVDAGKWVEGLVVRRKCG